MSENDPLDRVVKRLNILVMLTLEQGGEGGTSMAGKIKRLLDFGLAPSEVADIVGKPAKYVAAVKSKRGGSKAG